MSNTQCFLKQDQTSNRYDSILHWLRTENGLVITDSLTHSHTPYLEMLSHLKTDKKKKRQEKKNIKVIEKKRKIEKRKKEKRKKEKRKKGQEEKKT